MAYGDHNIIEHGYEYNLVCPVCEGTIKNDGAYITSERELECIKCERTFNLKLEEVNNDKKQYKKDIIKRDYLAKFTIMQKDIEMLEVMTGDHDE